MSIENMCKIFRIFIKLFKKLIVSSKLIFFLLKYIVEIQTNFLLNRSFNILWFIRKNSVQLRNVMIWRLLYSWNSILAIAYNRSQVPPRIESLMGKEIGIRVGKKNVNEQQQQKIRYFITDLIQVPMRLLCINKRLRVVCIKSFHVHKNILLLLWSTETL